jgi:hypothetical protein
VLGRELTASSADPTRIWVIDEITAVAGWVPVVKELRDNTQLASDAVVLAGSSAADLDEARRSLGAGLFRPDQLQSVQARLGVPAPRLRARACFYAWFSMRIDEP